MANPIRERIKAFKARLARGERDSVEIPKADNYVPDEWDHVVAAGLRDRSGLSAYDVWVKAGNIGTERDFIDSLRGPLGCDGLGDHLPPRNRSGNTEGYRMRQDSQWPLPYSSPATSLIVYSDNTSSGSDYSSSGGGECG